ncbi:cation:proton antiporter [Halococcus sp. IIIV-5B]|uniref:cation:proton antiporter n=1 Tax=Halococcus sp. IIIV-5B TaxID=2321230 RepID=UPI000E747AC7|nr:cation:proton antiporter [Halococcus sp. IIIV-5B]RJT03142.1 cation:proton antiporter [Halococcus sp. IIIV-5B]
MAKTLLLELGVMFAAIALGGALARALDQSVIPFYVLAGLAVNPYTLGALGLPSLGDNEVITVAGELGIVFLLFFLGLEFSIDQLLESGDRMVKAGLVDLGINFPVGVGIGLALGWTVLEAVVLGGVVYISSSAVITKSLIDLGWIANAESGPILGTLVFEDLVIAVYLAALAAVLTGGGDLATAATGIAVVAGFLLALVALVAFGETLFERYLGVRSDEQFVLRTVAVTVLIAGGALAVGASEAVAAFFVGMGFSSTDHVERIEERLIPLRDVFAAVFFFWIGLTTDPRAVVGVVGVLAVAVVLTTPTKFVSGYVGGRLYDLDTRRSVRVGCGLVTRGEFSLIIAALVASQSGSPVLSETIPAFAVGYVLVMSVLGTTLMAAADTVEAGLRTTARTFTGGDRP